MKVFGLSRRLHQLFTYTPTQTRRTVKTALLTLAGLCCIPALRAAIKSYRARKSAGDIIVDAVEAAIDEVDHKK